MTLLRFLFERYFCIARIRTTQLGASIHVTGLFSYHREALIPANRPVISPCSITIFTCYALPQPLRPLAPCH